MPHSREQYKAPPAAQIVSHVPKSISHAAHISVLCSSTTRGPFTSPLSSYSWLSVTNNSTPHFSHLIVVSSNPAFSLGKLTSTLCSVPQSGHTVLIIPVISFSALSSQLRVFV